MEIMIDITTSNLQLCASRTVFAAKSKFTQRKALAYGVLTALTLLSSTATSKAYSVQTYAWPAGSVITLQMNLGPLSKQLKDGSPTWSAAVTPVLQMWNQKMLRIRCAPGATAGPVSSGDNVNSVVFAGSIFWPVIRFPYPGGCLLPVYGHKAD